MSHLWGRSVEPGAAPGLTLTRIKLLHSPHSAPGEALWLQNTELSPYREEMGAATTAKEESFHSSFGLMVTPETGCVPMSVLKLIFTELRQQGDLGTVTVDWWYQEHPSSLGKYDCDRTKQCSVHCTSSSSNSPFPGNKSLVSGNEGAREH